MTTYRKLHELVAATHSPFHADGSVAPEVVSRQARFLAENGIKTVFITGSTGECHSLTRTERASLYEAWAAAGPANGISVIAHVGANSLQDAIALAKHARDVGLSAISTLAPSYYKPVNVGGLVEWCAAVANAAPELPFYYYDIPSMTRVSFPVDQFLREASRRIPNLAGVKFTNLDLVAYRRSLDAAGDRYDLPWGTDEALLGALATGARGGVGSTYNWAPRLYTNLIAAFDRGDLEAARRLQSTSVAMVDAISATGFMGTSKALMARLGVDVGPARPPLDNPSPTDVNALLQKLLSLGFDEWGAKAP